MYHHVSILSQSGDVIITVERVTSVALDYGAGILAAITKTGWVSLPLRLGETVKIRGHAQHELNCRGQSSTAARELGVTPCTCGPGV